MDYLFLETLPGVCERLQLSEEHISNIVVVWDNLAAIASVTVRPAVKVHRRTKKMLQRASSSDRSHEGFACVSAALSIIAGSRCSQVR